MNSTLRALNRFGLGSRVGERQGIDDPRNWLKSQLDPSLTGIEATNLPSLKEVGSALGQARQSQNTSDEETRRTARQGLRQISGREISAVLQQRIATKTPFLERLVAFWSNHLCVSAQSKPQVLSLAGHYEREVIRPHVLGRFSDMVLASARHPAMLFYLDNARSIGPSSRGSRMAARRGRKRGLNENYARELLELHTVGVDGGYAQKDVEQLALIFTGWTVAGLGQGMSMGGSEQPAFMFRAALHEPGAKRVLGVRYPEAGVAEGERAIRDLCRRPQTARFVANKLVGHFVSDDPPDAAVERVAATFQKTEGDLLKVSAALVDLEEALHEPGAKRVLGVRYPEAGVAEGERAIRDLCRRPQTARFVANKLVGHFVSDDPPDAAVERVAATFQKTEGDLLKVSAALVDLEEAWKAENRKFRTPQDWLVAVLRGVGLTNEVPPRMGRLLRQLRHPLWAPAAPKGYGDAMREWADPDSLMNRAELGRSLAKRLNRSRFEPEKILELVDLPDSDPLRSLLADNSIGRDERLALGIAGPAFQWR